MTNYERCIRQTHITPPPNIPEGWLDCRKCTIGSSDNSCLGYYAFNMTEEQYQARRTDLSKKLGLVLPEHKDRTMPV